MTTFTAAQIKALPPHIRKQLTAAGVDTDAAGRVKGRRPETKGAQASEAPAGWLSLRYACRVCLVARCAESGQTCDECKGKSE